jgi:predicted nucleic acid-binding protein
LLEVVNVLSIAETKNRISQADAAAVLKLLAGLDIQLADEVGLEAFDRLPPLCRKHGLSSYDATYLDLAIRQNLPLASLDDKLREAATSVGIHVLGK